MLDRRRPSGTHRQRDPARGAQRGCGTTTTGTKIKLTNLVDQAAADVAAAAALVLEDFILRIV